MSKYSMKMAMILLVALIVYTAWNNSQRRERELQGVGQVAVDFSIPSLDGGAMTGPQDHRGKVVVLDFWSTFCPPCRRSMPMFQMIHRQYGADDLVLLSINVNPGGEGERRLEVSRFRNDLMLDFPILMDTGQASRLYGVDSIPHVVVIDRDGIVRHVHHAEVTERALREEIDNLVAGRVAR